MEKNARVPQYFFQEGLFGSLSTDNKLVSSKEIVKSVELGVYTINWFYKRNMTVIHMSILLALLLRMKRLEVTDDLPLQLIEIPKNSEQTLAAVVALWDSLQRQVGVWVGSIRQLLIESNLDPNNPDNYRAARELLFNQRSDGVDAGLDIKVNITGGGIKKCRPVSLFKSAVATEDKITVKINWFFVASSFVDFRTISGSESSILKYSSVNVDGYQSMPTKGGWLVRACYVWLSHLTNGFTRGLDIEWLKLESLVYGFKRDRTKRQRYDHVRQLKSAIIQVFVNFPVHCLDGDIMSWAELVKIAEKIDSAVALNLPVIKLRKLPHKVAELSGQFEIFWQIWPSTGRKEYKSYCHKIWRQMKLDEVADNILAAVRRKKLSDDWLGDKKFVPAPANWLKKRGWESC